MLAEHLERVRRLGYSPRRWASSRYVWGRQHWLTALAALLVLAVSLALWANAKREELYAVQAVLLEQRVESPVAAAVAAGPQRGFVEALPQQQPSLTTQRLLAQAAQQAGVTLMNLALEEQAPSAQALGRQSFSASVRGTYADTKRWLASSLGSDATVSLVRMRVEPGSGQLETEVRLTVWAAPAQARGTEP